MTAMDWQVPARAAFDLRLIEQDAGRTRRRGYLAGGAVCVLASAAGQEMHHAPLALTLIAAALACVFLGFAVASIHQAQRAEQLARRIRERMEDAAEAARAADELSRSCATRH